MVGQFLYAWLQADPAITALLGSGDLTRAYPDAAPQAAAFPRLTYQVIDTPGEVAHDGPVGVETSLVQIDCWAVSRLAATLLGDAVRGTESNRKLDGYTGTAGGVLVEGSRLTGDREDFSPPVDAGDVGVYRRSLDFQITVRRP